MVQDRDIVTTEDYYYYNRFTALWILSETNRGWAGTREVKLKPVWISWSKRQWVVEVSAVPYANLHLAPDRKPLRHLTTEPEED